VKPVVDAGGELTPRWRRPLGEVFNGAVEVVEVLSETVDELSVICAPRHVATRGDTLNCEWAAETRALIAAPLITVSISSPTSDILRVKVQHHAVGCLSRPR